MVKSKTEPEAEAHTKHREAKVGPGCTKTLPCAAQSAEAQRHVQGALRGFELILRWIGRACSGALSDGAGPLCDRFAAMQQRRPVSSCNAVMLQAVRRLAFRVSMLSVFILYESLRQ